MICTKTIKNNSKMHWDLKKCKHIMLWVTAGVCYRSYPGAWFWKLLKHLLKSKNVLKYKRVLKSNYDLILKISLNLNLSMYLS